MSLNEKHEPSHEQDVHESKRSSSIRASWDTCCQTITCTEQHLTSHPATSISPLHEYPDGGLRGWLAVLGAFCALFCTFGLLNTFGTFQSWYSDHQLRELTPSTISWIGALQLWVFFFSGGFVGRLFDLYGPRPLMLAGSACYVMSIMLTSICVKYYQYLLVQGLLFGLGVGLIFYPALSSVTTHFIKYRATALGIAVAGSSVGGVVYPILLHKLFSTVGFPWGLRIAGLIGLLGCGVSILLVSRAPTPHKPNACLGWRTFKDARFSLLALGGCFVALGLFIPFFYIVDYAQDLSPASSHDISFLVLAIMNAGGIFGRIIPAYLADVIGNFNLLAPAALLSGLLCLGLWLQVNTVAGVLVFAAAYGVCSGAFISVITPCVGQISDGREIGYRIGLVYSVVSFPALAGGPAAGALLRVADGGYRHLIVFSGTTLVLGSLIIGAARLKVDSRILVKV